MNLKKLALIFIVILVAVCLMAPVLADAKSKSKGKSKGKSKSKSNVRKNFQDHLVLVGADIGANVFGAVPFGTITIDKGGANEDEVNFNGTGGFGFLGGVNAHVHFEGWIVRGEFAYSQQDGTFSFEGKDSNGDTIDVEDNFRLNNLKLGVGFGKSLVKHRIIHPYLLGVLDYHYMDFRNTDQEDEKAKGSGLGVGGIIGLDALIPKMGGLVVGGGARLDLIYTVNPLKIGDNEITMGYFPIAIFLKGGWMFM